MQKVKDIAHKITHPKEHRQGQGVAGDDMWTAGTTGTAGTAGTAGTGTYGATGTEAYNESYTTGTTSTSSGDIVTERPVGVGIAEVPVVVTEQERLSGREQRTGMAGEEVCGVKTFTEVEDRPIVKEVVERVLEHRPVEKQYVVETRFVGETAIPSATGATVIDRDERIVEVAQPGPACPANTGRVMDEVIEGTRRI